MITGLFIGFVLGFMFNWYFNRKTQLTEDLQTSITVPEFEDDAEG